MHKLCRRVRFSINPFLSEDSWGANSFSSKPAGEGLAIFLELGIGVVGQVEPSTGFVINVLDIDKAVREYAVPIFAGRIRDNFRKGRHIGLLEIAELLRSTREHLTGRLGKAVLSELSLKLNPFRKVAIGCGHMAKNRQKPSEKPEDKEMIYFSEKFEFAAMHKLWNEDFSRQRNFEVFGKCANPAGHGHNYVVEVTVQPGTGGKEFGIGDFEKIVDDELIKLVDHKNLNVDVDGFDKTNPTIENIASFAWGRLVDKFGDAKLHCITIWETDKTCCSYYG